jgi:hypothetical protein
MNGNNETSMEKKRKSVRSNERKDYRVMPIKALDTAALLICAVIAALIWLYN